MSAVNLSDGPEILAEGNPFEKKEEFVFHKAVERINCVAEEKLLLDPATDSKEPLLAENNEIDLEAQTKAAKKDKKAKKLKEQKYLLEVDLPVLGKIKIAPYYSDDDDEDDNAAKRESLGVKENVAFAVGLAVISLFSGYFYRTPFVSSAIAGGAIDISKTWYVYTEKQPLLRNSARVIAAITLIGSIVLQYQAGDKTKLPALLQILSALPGVYPAMGFLKAEISNAKPEDKLVALASKCRASITKKTAESIFSAMMAAAGLGLTFVPEKNLAATGGIFFKTNIRNLSDMIGKTLFSLENPRLKALAGTAMAVSSTAAYTLALVGTPLGWFKSSWGKLAGTVLIVPPSDIASRTVKASIKADLNEKKAAKKAGIPLPEEEKSWIKTGVGAALHITPIIGACAAVGIMADPTEGSGIMTVTPSPDEQNLEQNSGVIAALFGDIVAFSKVATKKFDEKTVLGLSAVGVCASALTYGLVESGKWALPKIVYSSSLVFGSLAAAYAIYHLKRLVRPPELSAKPEPAQTALCTEPQVAPALQG